MTAVKRLPSNPHDRAVALVRDSMPRRDYREFPEPVARTLRDSACERAVLYAAIEDVTDEAARLAEDITSSDGVVVDLCDDEDARSVVHHLNIVEDLISAEVDS